MVKKSCISFEKSLRAKYSQVSLELLDLKCLDSVVGSGCPQQVERDRVQVSTDDRLNSITLIGEPRKVEVATSL